MAVAPAVAMPDNAGMDKAHATRGTVVGVIILMLTLLATSYIAAYLLCTSRDDSIFVLDGVRISRPVARRVVSQAWMVPLFMPLATVESVVEGEDIVLTTTAGSGWISTPSLED